MTERKQLDPEKSLPIPPSSTISKGRDSLMDSLEMDAIAAGTREAIGQQDILFPTAEVLENNDEIVLLQEWLAMIVEQSALVKEALDSIQPIPDAINVLQKVKLKKENKGHLSQALKEFSTLIHSVKFITEAITEEKMHQMITQMDGSKKPSTFLYIERAVRSIDDCLAFPKDKQNFLEEFLMENQRYAELKTKLQAFQQLLREWQRHFKT